VQRFFSRLAWNALSVRAKIGVILITSIALIGIVSGLNAALQNSAGTRTQTGINAVVELRTLGQNVLVDVQEFPFLQTRLVLSYAQAGFDPTTSTLLDDYSAAAVHLREEMAVIRELAAAETDATMQSALETELINLEASLTEAEQDFQQTFSIAGQLSNQESGAIITLDSIGDRLDVLTNQVVSPQLRSLETNIRGLERSLIQTGSNQDLLDLRQSVQQYRVLYTQTATQGSDSTEVFGTIDQYLDQVDTVALLLVQVDLANRSASSSLGSIRTAASRVNTLLDEIAQEQVGEIQQNIASSRQPLVIGVIIQIAGLTVLLFLFGRTILNSMQQLLETARRFEDGNLRARVRLSGQDEFSELGRSFNSMAGQLEDLIGGLEARVAERTRDLSITAEIGQAVLASHDPRSLMTDVVELIRQRFDFYHVQIFIVDDERENARLIASTGTVGRQLVARRHSLPVGSQSVIGQVTSTGEHVIALDTDTSVVHRRNELLPDTRSEMALPMRIGDRIIGALDVQSIAANAFYPDSVAIFQIMADQLAIALENARLQTEIADMNVNFNTLEKSVIADTWRGYQRNRPAGSPSGYELLGEVLQPRNEELPAALEEAVQRGKIVASDHGADGMELALPIRVRGEAIGAFGFTGDSLRNLTEEDYVLLEAVVDRVGLALENMRLVEQTARRAEYEQIVNSITAKIVGSTDINHILQTTVKELGRALRAPQTSVQLHKETMDTHDE